MTDTELVDPTETESALPRALLDDMSRSERRDVIEELAVGHFRTALLMEDGEEVPRDTSYFDMGLTSLRLTSIRQSLESTLDLGIDATAMFNRPTLDDLIEYLTDLVTDRPGST